MLLKKISIIMFSIMLITSCDMIGNNKPDDEIIHIDGLSSKLVLAGIPQHRSFSRDIVDGYESLEEFSNDLDRLGYEAGLNYIENYTPWVYLVDDVAADTAAPENTKSDSNTNDYETNTQVSGVDEADIVKSDGEYVYMIARRELIIFNLDGEIITRTSLFDEGYSLNLLLHQNKLVAYGNDYYKGSSIVIMTVENGGITYKESYKIKSHIRDMRMKNGNVIVFANNNLQLWEMYENLFDDIYYGDIEITDTHKEMAKEKLLTEVPKWRNKLLLSLFGDGDNVDMDFVKNILKMYEQSNDDIYESFNEVFSFHVDTGFSSIERSGSFTNGWSNAIYSDGSFSIISNRGWVDLGNFNWKQITFLTTFYTDGNGTSPMAVTSFDGDILNQFSIDSYNGYIRVGVTENRWKNPTNSLLVFDEETLEEVGRLENLGEPNESIQSMRFTGDKAYMVTFERTDPFYTLDLSDPYNPSVLGELKINGFSSYIHPIDDTTLLTIGMDADDNGWTTGFQVSLYDVSNYSSPTRTFNKTLEGSWSNANRDHHAFRYVSSLEKLIVPVNRDFTVFNIDKADGISIHGEINHANEENRWYYYFSPRSMVIDGNIITMSRNTIISSKPDDLETNWKIELTN